MREIVFLQHVQGFDDLTKNGTDRGEAQRLAGLREILAQRHAGIELRDHQRHLAHVLKLQHLREMGSMEAVALTSCKALRLLTIKSWQSRAST